MAWMWPTAAMATTPTCLALGGMQSLTDSGGIDSIDLSDAAFGVDADLNAGFVKFRGQSAIMATLDGTFENLPGTSYDDTITGNSERNILEGGGGNDWLDGGDAADTVQGSFTQTIYLDFDSGTGFGEHAYTIEERNQIQARLEKAFPAPFSVTFTQTAPSVGRFTTVVLNAGEAEALVGGVSDELDWRNLDAASQARINVNGFLGRKGQPAATSANYVALTFTVTAHEIGHLFGLRHSDSFGPIGSGIYSALESAWLSNEQCSPAAFADEGTKMTEPVMSRSHDDGHLLAEARPRPATRPPIRSCLRAARCSRTVWPWRRLRRRQSTVSGHMRRQPQATISGAAFDASHRCPHPPVVGLASVEFDSDDVPVRPVPPRLSRPG